VTILSTEKVTPEAAERDYGVIAHPESLRVDVDASLALRERKKRERGPVSWMIDRAVGGASSPMDLFVQATVKQASVTAGLYALIAYGVLILLGILNIVNFATASS